MRYGGRFQGVGIFLVLLRGGGGQEGEIVGTKMDEAGERELDAPTVSLPHAASSDSMTKVRKIGALGAGLLASLRSIGTGPLNGFDYVTPACHKQSHRHVCRSPIRACATQAVPNTKGGNHIEKRCNFECGSPKSKPLHALRLKLTFSHSNLLRFLRAQIETDGWRCHQTIIRGS